MRNAVLTAAGMLGSQSALAKLLEISPGAVSQFVSGIRKIPEQRCPSIEVATLGSVKCEELRPDVAWIRVQDPDWPHPLGRPCIDVAAPIPAASIALEASHAG